MYKMLNAYDVTDVSMFWLQNSSNEKLDETPDFHDVTDVCMFVLQNKSMEKLDEMLDVYDVMMSEESTIKRSNVAGGEHSKPEVYIYYICS